MSVKLAAQRRFSAIKVYYVSTGPVVPAPSAPKFYYNGNEKTGTVTIEEGENVSVECETDATLFVNDASTNGYEYTINAAGTYTAYAERDGRKSEAVSLTVKIKGNDPEPESNVYVKVNSASELSAGDKIIVVSRDTPTIAMALWADGKNCPTVTAKYSDQKITCDDAKLAVITLEGEAGKWYLKTSKGYLYAASSSKNYLKAQNTPTAWSIDYSGQNVTVKCKGSFTNNILQYNESNTLFSCYANATLTAVDLYKLYVPLEESDIEPEAAISPAAGTVGNNTDVTVTFSGFNGQNDANFEFVSLTDGTATSTTLDANHQATITLKGAGEHNVVATYKFKGATKTLTAAYTIAGPSAPAISGVTVAQGKILVDLGDTFTVASPDGGDINFTAAPGVATYDASTGTVTITGAGVITLTATVEGLGSTTTTITAELKAPGTAKILGADGAAVTAAAIDGALGDIFAILAANDGDTVAFTFSPEGNAELLEGNQVKITAVGNTTITAWAERNGLKGAQTVLTVKVPDPNFVAAPVVTYKGTTVGKNVTIYSGESVTVNCKAGDTLYVNGTAQSGTTAAIYEEGTYTVYAQRGEYKSEEVVFTVSIKKVQTYKLVTSNEDLVIDAEYVICNKKVETGLTSAPGGMAKMSGGYYTKVDVDGYNNDEQTIMINPDSEIAVFTYVKEGDKTYLMTGGKYLNLADKKNGFRAADTPAEATDLKIFNIKSDGTAQIKLGNYYIRGFGSNDAEYFRTYEGEVNDAVYIYVLSESIVNVGEVVFTYADGDIDEDEIDAIVGQQFGVRAVNEGECVNFKATPSDGIEILTGSDFALAAESGKVTVTAWAEKDGHKGEEKKLVINAHGANYIPAPMFPASSTIADGAMLKLRCGKEGAQIYYRYHEDGAWLPYPEDGIPTSDLGWVFTIWAKAEYDGNSSEIVSKQFSVDSDRTYKLVKEGDKLNFSDQFIIVSATKMVHKPQGTVPDNDYSGNPALWALSTSRRNNYYTASEIASNDADSTVTVHAGQDVLVLSIQPCPDDEEGDVRRYLFMKNNFGDDYGKYVYVSQSKDFTFKELPSNTNDRQKMYGTLKIYEGPDYVPTEPENKSTQTYHKETISDKTEVIFSGVEETIIRFNPVGQLVHFNAYTAKTNDGNETDGSRSGTYPVRIYRLEQTVEKPSITVLNEAGDKAYDQALTTFNNKVKVEIEAHPRTSDAAEMFYNWSDLKNAPVLNDYTDANARLVTLYVDGDKWYDANGNEMTAPERNAAKRVLYAMSTLGDVQSTPTSRLIQFKTLPPKLKKVSTDADNGVINVQVTRPTTYTVGATLYYTMDGTDPATSATRMAIEPGAEPLQLPTFATLRVAAVKDGYESSEVQFNDATVFPECRPMQLLRLTDDGINEVAGYLEQAGIEPTAEKPVYINHRQDVDDPDIPEYYYFFQREHEYGVQEHEYRGVLVEKVDKEVFNIITSNPENFYWTSDYYVFVMNKQQMLDNFEHPEEVAIVDEEVKVIDGDKEYIALKSYVELEEGNVVQYYGAMLENRGSIGVKELTSTITYSVDGNPFTTENNASITPVIPNPYRVRYLYQDSRHEGTLADTYGDYDYLKFKVPSSVKVEDGDEAPAGWNTHTDVLVKPGDIQPRRLDAVLKFTRPNISPLILENYDIYYTVNFYSVNETTGERRLLRGSGIYRDEEKDYAESEDNSYRFLIEDVSPLSTVNPELEVAATRFVGNDNAESAYSSFTANYGTEAQSVVAKNNSRKGKTNIGNIWLTYKENEADGTVDWTYIGHTDLTSQDVIFDTDPSDETTADVYINGMFFHMELKLGGEYRSYEHLAMHIDDHRDADDPSNPEKDRDPMAFVTVAKGMPKLTNPDGTLVHPDVILSPVYVFQNNVNAFNEAWNEEVDLKWENPTGTVGLTEVRLFEVPEREVPAEAAAAASNAPKHAARRAAEGDNEITRLPHAGDVSLTGDNGEKIIDLTDHPSYVMVKGQELAVDGSAGQIMTGVEDITVSDAEGETRYYNLQGQRTTGAQRGFLIRVQGGKATKELNTGR